MAGKPTAPFHPGSSSPATSPRKTAKSPKQAAEKPVTPSRLSPLVHVQPGLPKSHRGFSKALPAPWPPVRQSLTGEWLGGPEVTRHLPFFAFIVALILGYTYLEYQYEYDERAIKEGRKELRDLRHHEQSLRGRFESQLQRSRLDEDMARCRADRSLGTPHHVAGQIHRTMKSAQHIATRRGCSLGCSPYLASPSSCASSHPTGSQPRGHERHAPSSAHHRS